MLSLAYLVKKNKLIKAEIKILALENADNAQNKIVFLNYLFFFQLFLIIDGNYIIFLNLSNH